MNETQRQMTWDEADEMKFEQWWKLLKPAECDEVKPQFEECWQQAYQAGREEAMKVCEYWSKRPDGVGRYLAKSIKEIK